MKAPAVIQNPRKHITRTLEIVGRRHGMRRVWEDWTEALALSWANIVGNLTPVARDDEWHAREARYLELVKHYTADEWREIAGLNGPLTDALEDEGDVLGELFMTLDFGNERAGQFFTPWHLCAASARLLLGDGLAELIERRGFITVDDPACGSGTMLLAAAHVAREIGFNPQRQMWVHGRDLSASAVHMAFINLAARGLPGVIEIGNSLTLEVFSRWNTPEHLLGAWSRKLTAEPRLSTVDPAAPTQPVAPAQPVEAPEHRNERAVPTQCTLF